METVWQLDVKLPVGVGIMGRVSELALAPGGVMSGAVGQLSRAMLITEDTSTIRSLFKLALLGSAALVLVGNAKPNVTNKPAVIVARQVNISGFLLATLGDLSTQLWFFNSIFNQFLFSLLFLCPYCSPRVYLKQ